MRTFEKWAWISVVILMIAPLIGVAITTITGNAQVVPLGEIAVTEETNGAITIASESNTWAEYLASPLVDGTYNNNGVMHVVGKALLMLQNDIGVKLSTPAVYIAGVGVLLFVAWIVHFMTDMLTFIPKWIEKYMMRWN